MSEQLLATPCTFGENGNFLLERELGAGGMGGVYMGRDKMLDRPVAVKVMLKEYGADAEFVSKFKKEAQAAAKLIHPNIAQIYSYGISDGMPYIAMELVAGGSLWTVMQSAPGKTDVTRVLKICQQVAQALQCSTDQGFVHGDIKPENILLDANGNAKLVDFGLAGMQKDTDEIWGTPYYIAPEKVRQEGVDFRADMYNLGGTLYHALTNLPPFEGEDVNAVVKARFFGAPKKPSEIRPDLTPAVDALVMRMLEADKDKRFPSFEALIAEIKRVLTSGLEASAGAPAAPAAGTGATGARRTTVRGVRRMTTVRKRPASVQKDGEDTGDEDAPKNTDKDDEDEEGGNLGLKVAGAVVGGLLLIGAVIGGLIWYKVAAKKSADAAYQAQIVQKIERAREAIAGNRAQALKFADEFDEFASKAVTACKTTTDELKKLLPDWANEMQPPPSAELLAAIASTNEAAATPAPAAAPAATNAAAFVAAKMGVGAEDMAKAVAAMMKEAMAQPPAVIADVAKQVGMPPPPKDFDPKSAAGQDYAAKLDAAVHKALKEGKKIVPPKGFKAVAAAAEADQPAAEPEKQRPPVLDEMKDLWDRAYSCQASAARIRHQASQLAKACDAAAEIKGTDEASMRQLADLSNKTTDSLGEIRASKDVENVRKGITYIKQKGEKTVEKTAKRLRIEKLEADRRAAKEKEIAAEKAKHEAAAAAKAKLAEDETAAAKDKFEALASQGVFAQLGWDDAIRQLKQVKDGCKTAEGGFAAATEIHKVEVMKAVQDIFRANLPGYTFKKDKIKGCKVRQADATQIEMVKADGKTVQKLTWRKLYKECHKNLNELINTFVVKGRENGKKRLSLKEWSDAMCGAALTMRILCDGNESAAAYGEKLVKQVYEAYPDYQKNLKAMFPDISPDGEEAPAAEKSEAKAGEKSE